MTSPRCPRHTRYKGDSVAALVHLIAYMRVFPCQSRRVSIAAGRYGGGLIVILMMQ